MNKSNRNMPHYFNNDNAIWILLFSFVIALCLYMAFSIQTTDKTVDTTSVVETTETESIINEETFESVEVPLSDGTIGAEFNSASQSDCSTMLVSNPFPVTDEFSENSNETSEVTTEEEAEESVGESIDTISSIDLVGDSIEEPTEPEYDFSEVPLDPYLIDIIVQECTANNVPIPVALAVINTESNFVDGLWSSANCYGLMQLHASYFPNIYTPEENLQTGIRFLGSLIDKHGDIYIALNVYANGHCTYDFSHQYYVMSYAEEWSAKTGASI